MTFKPGGESQAGKDHQSRKASSPVCMCVWVSGQVSAKMVPDCVSLLSHCQKINSGLSLKRRPISSIPLPLVQRNVNICLAFCVKVMKF